MQAIEGFIDELIAVVRAESGIRYAPDDPPSSLAADPAAVVWLTDGRSVIGPPGLATHHVGVRIGLLTSMQNIAMANQRILPRIQPVIQAIWRALQAGTFTNAQNIESVEFTYGPIQWGDVWYFGAIIDLGEVKLQAEL
jgi:hypothetical protein